MIGDLVASSVRRPYGAGPRDYPHVSTRGRYQATWLNSVYTRNNGSRYDVHGAFPGLDDGSPTELTLFVHGWLADKEGALGAFATTENALRSAGYTHPVAGYTWDSDTAPQQWWAATIIARRNGVNLAEFLNDYHHNNPDTDLRIVAHSLGSRVALEALNQLDGGVSVASVTLLGAAAGTTTASMNGRYGDAITRKTGELHNFHKTTDSVLAWLYSFSELTPALGQQGVRGTPPSNYEDHRVDHVSTHYSYFVEDEGCIPQVLDTFN